MVEISASEALFQRLTTYLHDRSFDAAKINAFERHVAKIRETVSPAERVAMADRLREGAPTGDLIRLHSVLFQLAGDLYDLERIFHYLLLGRDSVDPGMLHYTYWCVQRQLFLGRARPEKAGSFGVCDLFRFYRAMVGMVADRWGLTSTLPERDPAEGLRRVVLITNQFTNANHQPSRDVFDFARLLQDRHGLDVMIVNGNLLPISTVNMFIPPFSAEVVAAYEGARYVTMYGKTVPMASFTGPHFEREKLASMIATIDRFAPDVVIGFGGSNIVADLYAMKKARPVICLPTTTGFTVSMADIILGFDRNDWTAKLPEAYASPFKGRFRPFTFGYTLPPLAPERDAYTLPDGAPVLAVVGTRLDLEVSAEFLGLLERVVDAHPDVVIAFAGEVKGLPARLAKSRHADRLASLGHIFDIRSFYRRCAAMLNPRRQGGGGGAAYALAEGVPVVSFPGGDVASVAGPDALVSDEAAFLERVGRLLDNPAYRAEAGREAKGRFAEIGDRDRSSDELLHYCQTLLASKK